MNKNFKQELYIGESFEKGSYIQNSAGAKLIFQNDGNLVLYDNPDYTSEENILWESGTANRGNKIDFSTNGNFAIFSKDNEIVWETKTGNLGANCLSIEGFTPVILTKNQDYEQYSMTLQNTHFRFKANKNIFDKEISVGVVLVGSLLWQDDGKLENDNQRKDWRDRNFVMTNNELTKIPIQFPIRYGRMSQGNVYTMVVSSELSIKNKLGTAMLVKAKRKLNSKQEVLDFVKELADAEGIKSKEVIKASWAFIAYGLNPKIKQNRTITKPLDAFWGEKAKRAEYYKIFKMDSEDDSVLNSKGGLDFIDKNWLKSTNTHLQTEIDGTDLVFVTVTKPCLSISKIPDQNESTGFRTVADISRYPALNELVDSVNNDAKRFYFYNNVISGIKTFDDDSIIDKTTAPSSIKSIYTQSRYDVFNSFELKRLESKRLGNLLIHFTSIGQVHIFDLIEKRVNWKSSNYNAHFVKYDARIGDLRVYWKNPDNSESIVWQIEAFRYSQSNQMTYQVNNLYVNGCEIVFSITERWGWINQGEGYRDHLPDLVWRTSSGLFDNQCDVPFWINKSGYVIFKDGVLSLTDEGIAQFKSNDNKVVWTSPMNQNGERLCYQEDGNLVIYINDDPKWSADIYSHKGVSKDQIISFKKRMIVKGEQIELEVTDRKTKDGELDNLYWPKNIKHIKRTFYQVCNEPFELKKGEAVKINDYYVYFSIDGQIELQNKKGDLLWSSPSDRKGMEAIFQNDGNFFIRDKNNNQVWSIGINNRQGVYDKTVTIRSSNQMSIVDNALNVTITNRSVDGGSWGMGKLEYKLVDLFWNK